MCLIAMTVWFLTVVNELTSSAHVMRAIAYLPIGKGSAVTPGLDG